MSKIQLADLNNVSHLTELNHENLDLFVVGVFFGFRPCTVRNGVTICKRSILK
jgi:hypothetical protein